ncbi:uncharacterized protein LOC119589918 isoform X2 [Penaeus monodon]|uniref:uncharacterized protein LOC119589918 isoform X2 n=1 Tax=Penaeus monodon TaxID=6687 RepID=UPI0018A6E3A4|nr:uncharacterized protein LOC119589918 isoform X2 [Penaeus monodon]
MLTRGQPSPRQMMTGTEGAGGTEVMAPHTREEESPSGKTGDEQKVKSSAVVSAKCDATVGVLIQEVDEGQPCLMCRDKCPGYTAHVWR